MSNVEIKKLFQFNRFTEKKTIILLLILYFPFGLLLFVLRVILAVFIVFIGSTLSDVTFVHKLVNKIACVALGIRVQVENPEKNEHVDVYLSNNVSIFDHLAIYNVSGSVSPGSQLHPAISTGLGLYNFGPKTNQDAYKRAIDTFIQTRKIPIHFTPEEKLTDGSALLKFTPNPYWITSQKKVQPISIRVQRPILHIRVTKFSATYWTDVFFYMFSPLTVYTLRFLPSFEKVDNLEEREFCETIRQRIATDLQVGTPDISSADVNEWEKRFIAEKNCKSPQISPANNINDKFQRMAIQVKEVLPHVPLNAIVTDLRKTNNIDVTITNVLEGNVIFTPEPHQNLLNNPGPSTSSTGALKSRDIAFPKSAHERCRSFKERKELMITEARKRYIEKHNLNIPL